MLLLTTGTAQMIHRPRLELYRVFPNCAIQDYEWLPITLRMLAGTPDKVVGGEKGEKVPAPRGFSATFAVPQDDVYAAPVQPRISLHAATS